ncbi:peptidylprolyl isomerase [uncultured Odoribacter sp.]|uniref:peptidylprolyl isomerase n=1 Tax=uncultured Odoribacter sp. TaxID=876416 RepID=UPI0026135D0F|nr:peptidylprolyl isomerase [uncultured Odoribacter sp.]
MRRGFLLLAILCCSSYIFAQNNVVDKIIAIVGEEIILKSDIENEFLHEQGQGLISTTSDYRAEILERQLIQKLLLAQAKLDSISVTEDEVENEVNSRVQYLTTNIGSRERLEAYFGKNIEEIKSDMRAPIREKLITEMMQQKIVEKIRSTPSEIKTFYKKLPKDSLPDIPDKYEIQQIVIKPAISEAEKERIREKLRGFRDQILSGEKTFNTLAVLYSEDGSAVRGGELGYSTKSMWDPAFAEAAFSLKPGKISKIVESEFGFHIIQLIDRQGERINVRHIILQPKISDSEREEAIHRLDSIREYILDKEMTFEDAAYYFSTDKQTRNNGGLMSGKNGDSRIEKAEIEGDMAKQVNRMKVGEISEPFVSKSEAREEYKIIKVKAFYPQHKANLEDDWQIFEMLLKNEKQMDKLEKWIKEKQENTYIHIDDSYKNSKFRYEGWIK